MTGNILTCGQLASLHVRTESHPHMSLVHAHMSLVMHMVKHKIHPHIVCSTLISKYVSLEYVSLEVCLILCVPHYKGCCFFSS